MTSITVRLTASEHDDLAERARDAGAPTISAYVRETLALRASGPDLERRIRALEERVARIEQLANYYN